MSASATLFMHVEARRAVKGLSILHGRAKRKPNPSRRPLLETKMNLQFYGRSIYGRIFETGRSVYGQEIDDLLCDVLRISYISISSINFYKFIIVLSRDCKPGE